VGDAPAFGAAFQLVDEEPGLDEVPAGLVGAAFVGVGVRAVAASPSMCTVGTPSKCCQLRRRVIEPPGPRIASTSS
jgi:hypothetical protein